MAGSGILTWGASGPISARIDGNHGFISVSLNGAGGFQGVPVCPTIQGIPCGNTFATSAFFVGDVPSVPGPVLGAGLPGLIFAGGGLLGWHRRRRAISA